MVMASVVASVEVLLAIVFVGRGCCFFCLRFFFRAPDFLPSLQRTKTNSARVSMFQLSTYTARHLHSNEGENCFIGLLPPPSTLCEELISDRGDFISGLKF